MAIVDEDGDERGNTALHEAVRRKRWSVVRDLLQGQHVTYVNLSNHRWQTPLHFAAHRGAPEDIITRLISPHNINMQSYNGNTALHVAMRMKRWQAALILLEHGADLNLVGGVRTYIRRKGQDGNTLLHEALRTEIWELVPILHRFGADVSMCNGNDETPLHWAVLFSAQGHIVKQLITPYNINMQDGDGDTVLHEAVRRDRWDLVPILVRKGADVNLRNADMQTPLHLAAYCSSPAKDIITQLISEDNINMQDRGGNTALHNVLLRGKRSDLVLVLLRHGADINLHNNVDQIPLHLAAHHGALVDIITRLISPLNINTHDEDGETALSIATRKRRWLLMLVLLQQGAQADMDLIEEVCSYINMNPQKWFLLLLLFTALCCIFYISQIF